MIDDDEELCEETSEILIDQGYSVTTAFDGLRGKRLIEKYNYDILILDMKMPGLSGLDILQNVKEQNKELRVIILTGKPLTREEKILKRADAIISKPFQVEVLLGRIRELSHKP